MLFLWLVVLQLVIFAVLVLFLRVILSRNVTSATAHLQELNEDYDHKLEDARKRQAEADKYFDETVLKSKIEAEKAKMQILKEARENQEGILVQTRKQSEDILAQAEKAKESLLKEIDARIEQQALMRASELVQAALPSEITHQMHDRWMEDLFKHGLAELERLNLSAEVKEARVVSAFAMSTEQKNSLSRKFKESLKREIRLNTEVDPTLIAGVRITLGSVLIDGSLRFKIREVARHAGNNGK